MKAIDWSRDAREFQVDELILECRVHVTDWSLHF